MIQTCSLCKISRLLVAFIKHGPMNTCPWLNMLSFSLYFSFFFVSFFYDSAFVSSYLLKRLLSSFARSRTDIYSWHSYQKLFPRKSKSAICHIRNVLNAEENKTRKCHIKLTGKNNLTPADNWMLFNSQLVTKNAQIHFSGDEDGIHNDLLLLSIENIPKFSQSGQNSCTPITIKWQIFRRLILRHHTT